MEREGIGKLSLRSCSKKCKELEVYQDAIEKTIDSRSRKERTGKVEVRGQKTTEKSIGRHEDANSARKNEPLKKRMV